MGKICCCCNYRNSSLTFWQAGSIESRRGEKVHEEGVGGGSQVVGLMNNIPIISVGNFAFSFMCRVNWKSQQRNEYRD